MTDRVPIDEVVRFDIVTHNPGTGAVSDADSTPSFEVFEDDTDTDIGIGGNFTKRTSKTGNYRGTFTASAANGFEVGKKYAVIASATVNTIAAKAVAKHFVCVPAESSSGVPKTDISHFGGSAGTFASGIPEVKVASIANNAITTASINDNALTAAKIADGAIDAATFAANAITSTVIANDAITAAKIATDAIDADALAASAVIEIGAGSGALDAAGIRAAVGLASANLDTQLSGINSKTTNLPSDPADESLIIAATDAIMSRIGAPLGASISADIATKATPAQVNTEVLDVLTVDTFAQPGQEAPAATTSILNMLRYWYKMFRNKKTQTATDFKLYNDAETTVDQKSSISLSGGTMTRGEVQSGP